MSLETMTKLASTTVGVTAQSSISFTNIPQGYTDLVIKVSGRTAAAQGISELSFNSVTTGGSSRIMYGIGGAGSPGSATYASSIRSGYIVGTDYTASTFANNEIYISNYSSNVFKSVVVDSVTENNASEAYLQYVAGLWSNSSPITSLTFTVLNNNNGVASTFTQHSTFTLYGVKNAIKTAGNSIKATGGNIVLDGTYVYHVFNSTGAFTPTQPILSSEVLQVAGGGAGGWTISGGGGGGGVAYSTNQSFSPNITYACTVGAGAAFATSTYAQSKGSPSQLGTLTQAVGGGAGGAYGGSGGEANLNGGSGGGSGPFGSGGTATAGQGNNGGSGSVSTYYSASGGGGAGAAGSNGNGAVGGGNGGIGTAAYSSWNIGHLVSGVYYLAGGGGGGNYRDSSGSAGTPGTGGSGGGGNGAGGSQSTNTGTPGNGLANTGGGGGGTGGFNGGGGQQYGGSGGSGIIVVRYKS
jgi:hypothetical protein